MSRDDSEKVAAILLVVEKLAHSKAQDVRIILFMRGLPGQILPYLLASSLELPIALIRIPGTQEVWRHC